MRRIYEAYCCCQSLFQIWRQSDFRADFRPDDERPTQQYLVYCKEDGLSQGGKMPKRRLLEDFKQALWDSVPGRRPQTAKFVIKEI